MKELSNKISIEVLTSSVDPNRYDFLTDGFDFDPSPSNSDAGTVYDCGFSAVIGRPDADILSVFSHSRHCIVSIFEDNGIQHDVGSQENPAKVQILPYLNRARIKIEANMINSPLL
jgi:hypothetical protein